MTKTHSMGIFNERIDKKLAVSKIWFIYFTLSHISPSPIFCVCLHLLVCLIILATRQSKQALSVQVKKDHSLTLLSLPMAPKLGWFLTSVGMCRLCLHSPASCTGPTGAILLGLRRQAWTEGTALTWWWMILYGPMASPLVSIHTDQYCPSTGTLSSYIHHWLTLHLFGNHPLFVYKHLLVAIISWMEATGS